jgi:hypothetical protein
MISVTNHRHVDQSDNSLELLKLYVAILILIT